MKPAESPEDRPQVIPVDEKLPAKKARVLVVCKGFRCLGYLDDDGIWRDDAKGARLEAVTGWIRV
jgi:hypothetical protein